MPSATIVFIISALVSLVCSILVWALVMPEKKRPTLNAFFTFVSDVFNFRSLLIEKILKFTYLLLTLFAILFGFCAFIVSISINDGRAALIGLLVMILGPIALRLIYELSMMAVLLVKNVIEINNKMSVSLNDNKEE